MGIKNLLHIEDNHNKVPSIRHYKHIEMIHYDILHALYYIHSMEYIRRNFHPSILCHNFVKINLES